MPSGVRPVNLTHAAGADDSGLHLVPAAAVAETTWAAAIASTTRARFSSVSDADEGRLSAFWKMDSAARPDPRTRAPWKIG